MISTLRLFLFLIPVIVPVMMIIESTQRPCYWWERPTLMGCLIIGLLGWLIAVIEWAAYTSNGGFS